MKNSSKGTVNTGFTLIELVLVILIISLISALAMPYLWKSGKRDVKSEARQLSSALRYVHDESVAKKQPVTVTFNLENGLWGFASESENRTFTMDKNIFFRDIILPSRGTVSSGELILKFSTSGFWEPLTIHLSNGEIDYTVIFNHINGRAKTYEGYRI